MAGYGNFDYLYDDYGRVEVYTDGACENNGRYGAAAGIGVWFNYRHPLNLSEPVNGQPTNNRAEIQAAQRAVEQAASDGIERLCIYTDSQFLINAMTRWIFEWKKYNFQLNNGGRVKNERDFRALDAAIQKSGMEIDWNFVPAHSGITGNEQADRLARRGAQRYN